MLPKDILNNLIHIERSLEDWKGFDLLGEWDG